MKPEVISAVCTAVVALIAFVVSIFEIRRARKENMISRLPLLKVKLGTESGGFLAFGLQNEGNGAAFIEDIKLTVDGEQVELHMLLTCVFGEGKQFNSKKLVHQFPKIIQARSYEEVFRIAETGNNARTDVQLMHEFATRVGVHISSRPLKVSDERSVIDLPQLAERSEEGFQVST